MTTATKISPTTIVRDQNGFWTHPDYPDLEEGVNLHDATSIFSQLGVRTTSLLIEDDLDVDHPIMARIEQGDEDVSDWQPTPPTGEGWFLLSIHSSELGPVAIFGQPL